MNLCSYINGKPVESDMRLEVFYPWDNSLTGTVTLASPQDLETAIEGALAGTSQPLTRYERHKVLRRAAELVAERREELAGLICRESGLCMRETRYETGRTSDVLEFAAMEALRDDGEIFSCDISPQGKARKIYTFRQPITLAAAITPFNHPLNQVVHKLAPAIAAGAPLILKPSEKTPLTAIRMTEILYEAGLPPWMLSTLVGPIDSVVTPLMRDERVEAVTFTGSVEIGKLVANTAGYKKLCLELGGNSPLIVLDDADLELAVQLAAEGAFRNSGQRCTAVKRILVQDSIVEEFTRRLVDKTGEYPAGDPENDATRVGTVIEENAAKVLEARVHAAAEEGAEVRCGGAREGALMHPTVLSNVSRESEIVVRESFGPLAPILPIRDLDDAISYYNSGPFALSSAVVTNNLSDAIRACKELRTGTTNINEVPGYRLESTPFGGVKDSGLGVKEGVVEASKFYTNVKTYSLPW